MKKQYIFVSSITCPKCKSTIFSRARHDFRYCVCGDIAIDGGFDYVKISFKDVIPTSKRLRIYATRQELFDDWNRRMDKYGLIKKS